MKKHLLILASAAAILAAGCAKLDIKEISEDSSNIMSLVVKGMLESDPKVEYDSVIDEENGLVTVQIPYYMSDTEPIQADLTKMRVKASLPQGARFEPSIAGVHDLIEGFESTLVYASGKEKLYRFQAAYVKSSKAQLLSLVSTNQEVSVSITVSQPADPESKGVIHALRTPATEPALQTTLVTVSPWATVESEAYDSETGIYDLLQAKDLTVIAQDGTSRATYEVSFELPKTVDYGVGYLEALWGFQCYEDDPKGMSKDANSTLTSMVANAGCLNTISPTWLQLADDEGNVISLTSADYVTQAHNLGMDVWVLVDDFTYDVDLKAILSVTEKRERLVNTLVNEVLAVGADGINIDFEHVSSECGPHFAQFLRELSIMTHKYGLVLSVDNYVPEGGSPQYNRKEQGIVVDYVVIMGYDEHWSGCSEAGSVASIGYVERGIRDTINSGVPASKIINAVPFYTRVWKTSGAEVTSSALGMQAVQDWINQYNVTVVWDEETCQNYGELQGTDSLYEVWLEDAQSLQVKFNIMNNYGVAGMSAWKLGYETPDIWGLVEAYLNS